MKIIKPGISVLVLLLAFAFSAHIEAQNGYKRPNSPRRNPNKVTIEFGKFYAYKNSPEFFIFEPITGTSVVQLRDEKGNRTIFRQDKNDQRLFRKQGDPKTYFSYGGQTIAVNFVGGRKGTWTLGKFAEPNPGLKYVKQLKTGTYSTTLSYVDKNKTTWVVGGGMKSEKRNVSYTIRHTWKLSYNNDGTEMYLTSANHSNSKNFKKLSGKDRQYLFAKVKFKLGRFAYYNVADNRKIQVLSNSNFKMTFPGQERAKSFKLEGNATTNNTITSKTVVTTPVVDTTNKLSATSKTAQIHDAVRSGNYDKVENLVLKKGADSNLKDGIFGQSSLHYAASIGDNDIATLLVKSGNANVNLKDNRGMTPLDLAVEKNNLETAKLLLSSGANAGLATKGLDRVVSTKNKELLKMFLQNGANGNTALDKVIATDDVQLLNTVLDNSSARATNQFFEKAVNVRSQQIAIELLIRGVDKDKAMDFVIKKRNKQMVSLVLGTNPNVVTSNKALVFGVEQRDMTLAQDAIDAHNADPTLGMAPAVKTNNAQMVTFLLSKGADANDQMDEASAAGNKAIVELLLSQSANPDLGVKEAATNNQTATLQVLLDAMGDANLAMPIAIEKGNVAMVNMCIAAKKPADVYRTEYVVTACEKSNLDILNALLLAGADANPGMPISIAKKDVKLVRELVAAGADVNKPEYIKKSVELKDHATAQVLLEKGADANPGMPTAIKLGDVTMVNLLLKNGADGKTATFIATASEQGNTEITKMLLAVGADANNGVIPSIKNNKPKVLSMLINSGASANSDIHIKESIKHNNSILTKLIIDAGGNATAALEPSVNSNADKIITLISENGVDVKDQKYLAIAVNKNYTATANALTKAGSSAADSWDDNTGESLLHTSIRKHLNWNMVNILVSGGADVNKKTKSGDSPLHLAVYQGKKKRDAAADVVVVLIKAKADVNATNAKGETVLKAAPGKRKITKPLKKAGAKKRI